MDMCKCISTSVCALEEVIVNQFRLRFDWDIWFDRKRKGYTSDAKLT